LRYSGSAEYQARRRVNVDMADRYPFHLDVVEASIWLVASVALEQAILLLIISASLGHFSSVAHFRSVTGSYPCIYNDGPRFAARLLNKSRTGYHFKPFQWAIIDIEVVRWCSFGNQGVADEYSH
jgi:hypothetical protein